MARRFIHALVMLVALLSVPAVAHAARMSMYEQNGEIQFHYFADPGENNALRVTVYDTGNGMCPNETNQLNPRGPTCYVVHDQGAHNISLGGSCHVVVGFTYCDLGALGQTNDTQVHIYVKLGDGNDTVRLDTDAASAVIDGGPGDDTINTGGAAQIRILGGPGVDTFRCGPGRDQVGDRSRTDRATGCEVFKPLPQYAQG
jgi:Ca2+-binding RTX toxin-like protein